MCRTVSFLQQNAYLLKDYLQALKSHRVSLLPAAQLLLLQALWNEALSVCRMTTAATLGITGHLQGLGPRCTPGIHPQAAQVLLISMSAQHCRAAHLK